MKSMKIVSAAMLAMVGLGFAVPGASAATKTSTATIELTEGDDFKLVTVPGFDFTTEVTEGDYTISASGLNKQIEVYRNYELDESSVSQNEVHVTISDLSYDETADDVPVTGFSIGGKTLVGTAADSMLYADTEILTEVTDKKNNYTNAITSASIGFSSTAVGIGDELTATITYTAQAASTGN